MGGGLGVQGAALLELLLQDDLVFGGLATAGGLDLQRVIHLALNLEADLHIFAPGLALRSDGEGFQIDGLAAGGEEGRASQPDHESRAGDGKFGG